jgi:protoporphyrinogen oxidase
MGIKIAILGGGITGLTSAYYLAKKGHEVTVFEKEKILGGLASGFKGDKWNWNLERTYHHIFSSDKDILDFAKEIGFEKFYFKSPITSSLFQISNFKFQILPLDTPFDLLRFPYLPLFDKLRAGIMIVFLKLSPFLPIYKQTTSEDFLKKTMGINVWNILWQQLFRGKFGKYAGIILAVFIWARINKRTKKLGYVEGGFQTFIDYVEDKLKGLKVKMLKGYEVKQIKKQGERFIIDGQIYDKVISTLPTSIMTKLTTNIFSESYLERFKKLKYLHAITLIIETDKPILDKTYWLNICTDKIPFMVLAQHTNFADKKNYNGHYLAYVGWYVDGESKLLKMNKEEILKLIKPSLDQISNFQFPISKQIPNSKFKILNFYFFKAPFAQPIFDKDFEKNMPTFRTPDKNFFVANLDMTYPYDRGTNYAVKLGKEVSKLI